MFTTISVCLIGIIIGLLMGLTGNLFMGFVIVLFKYLNVGDYKTIIGTTLYVMVFPLTFGSVKEFYEEKKINFFVGNILLITLIIGSYFGSKLVLDERFKFTEKKIKYITAILLFSVSAIYHRVPWSPAKKKIWRRWDHANINLLIAGSYTPFAVTLLEGRDRTILLSVIWTGALIGVAVRVFWVGAPRWLYVANYLVLGWVAIIYTPHLYRSGGWWVILPIIFGGLLYSIGAIFYALKRPGRDAKYFGFHELFHIFVLAAWISQYVAICVAVYRSR